MQSAPEQSSKSDAAPGPMTRARFMARLLPMVGLIALYQIATMEVLIFHIMNPDWRETWVMLNAPGYVVAILLGVFTSLAYWHLKPLPDFLARISRGEEIGEYEVRLVQRRGLNFPYLAAAVGFGFYMFGGWWGVHVLVKKLGWPSELEFYGLVAGTVSAFLASPMCVYAYHWVTEPVIRLAGNYAPHLAPSRREGLRLSVRMKLILTVFSLSMGLATYPMVAGYTQSKLLSDKVEHDRGLDREDSLLRGGDANKSLDQFIGERMLVQGRIYLTLMAITIFSSLVLATLASRELTNPILMIRDEAMRVSQGDYNRPVTLVSNDEFADLGMALNRMNDTIIGQVRVMESVVTTLRQGIRQMDDTVRTVHDISSEQATGATEQASAVQQSSSIAQEIVASAAQIAERAGLMDEVAAATTQACREGEKKLEEARQGFHDISVQVGQVWSAMDELQERFQETYKIVEWMDDIAEQTELLALNAALEAAGAGEAGKRFSVVAQSTRRLAQRSREAVQEIRELVETIQKSTLATTRISDLGKQKTSRGGAAIEDAVSALQNISSFAGATSSAIREITLSTQQQTTASEQLAHSVREVQEVARKVEEGAREIQSAITELKSFSQSLQAALEN